MAKLFPYIYVLTIISVFGLGHIRIPGISFNFGQINYILLIIICFVIDKKILFDKYLMLYVIFMFFFFISSILTGFENTFISFFRTKLFTIIPVYWGTKILVKKYDNLYMILIPVIIIGILDSIVTVAQVYGITFFNPFLNILGTLNEEKSEMMVNNNITFGISISGIYSSAVTNGHNLLFMFCLSFMLIKNKLTFIRLLPSIVLLIGIFFCQQRSAFLLSFISLIVYSYIFLIKNMTAKKFILLVLFVLLIIILICSEAPSLLNNFSDSRLADINLSDRTTVFSDSIDYMFDNIFIGGAFHFTQLYGMPPHNLIISAFIAGGLIGGIVLMYMILSQIKHTYKKLKNNYSYKLLVLSIVFIAMICDSMTHNTGYVHGDLATFISWGLIYMSYNFNKNENNICK